MSDAELNKKACLAALPPVWPEELMPAIRSRTRVSGDKIVILDDDPTGTQTVHGLPVLTTWSVPTLENAISEAGPGFFILTNSRSMERRAACDLSQRIGENLKTASERAGIPVEVISRSDSTLRGHFPHEVDAVAKAMGMDMRPYLIFPFFPEGGRFTIDNIHYVAEKDRLVPAAMTPYAKDAAFGYCRSDLREWVAEKTLGRISAKSVVAISLEDIRIGGPERVGSILSRVPDRGACIVNAAAYGDVEVVAEGLLKASAQGRRFLLRTAAAFVRVRTGIEPREQQLSKTELVADTQNGGLFVVGSYVPKTTDQLRELIEKTDVRPVEIRVDRLLEKSSREHDVIRAAEEVNAELNKGRDVVLYTSRDLITGTDAETSLDIGQLVSDSLIAVVRAVRHRPGYLVAKGGITSSDVAVKGLNVRRAMVAGQILPGVPVWRLGDESRYPQMAYIVFPGNVGGDDALLAIQRKLA